MLWVHDDVKPGSAFVGSTDSGDEVRCVMFEKEQYDTEHKSRFPEKIKNPSVVIWENELKQLRSMTMEHVSPWR